MFTTIQKERGRQSESKHQVVVRCIIKLESGLWCRKKLLDVWGFHVNTMLEFLFNQCSVAETSHPLLRPVSSRCFPNPTKFLIRASPDKVGLTATVPAFSTLFPELLNYPTGDILSVMLPQVKHLSCIYGALARGSYSLDI